MHYWFKKKAIFLDWAEKNCRLKLQDVCFVKKVKYLQYTMHSAQHLINAKHLTWYLQYHHMDLLSVLLFSLLISLTLTFYFWRAVFR